MSYTNYCNLCLFLSGSDQKENVDLNIQSEGAFLNKG